jgi:DNA helicase-4
LEQGQFHSPYKLILVDEFQDISPGRARLVKALLASQEESVLFGVGDDWQAINGFAGSDLQLFMEFEQTFGHTREEMLTMTFRHPQGIADVGARFVMQNTKGQKPKKIISKFDEEVNGLVDLIDVYKDDNLSAELDRQLANLEIKHIADYGLAATTKTTVFLLSRYSLDKTGGLTQRWLGNAKKKYGHALVIEFKTMHLSKGLEADYVFLLGLNAGWGLTFPSTMRNDPLVDMLLTRHDLFPYAEERRLFYVALTRAKKRSTIMFRQLSPSPFVMELMDPYYEGRVTYHGGELPVLCDRCGKGFLVRRESKHGPFLGCTRYSREISGCTNKRRITPVIQPVVLGF